MRHSMRIFLIAALVTTLTACETVKGIGRDITRAAETVDRL
ncbi:MAG: entericidin EcnAB [Proteobacteria bacterium]|nr:entericidin EcnAB [Pseudomonadota bacterium]